MAFSFRKFLNGINIVPVTVSASSAKGDMEVDSSTGALKFHDGSSNQSVSLAPASSTDYALALFNGTGGNKLRNSTILSDANGNLGVGVSPSFLLHAKSIASTDAVLKFDTTTTGRGIYIDAYANGVNKWFLGKANGSDVVKLMNVSNANLEFSTNNTTRMVLNSSGDLDFVNTTSIIKGTSGGATKIQITPHSSVSSSAAAIIELNNTNSNTTPNVDGCLILASGGSSLGAVIFKNGSTEAARFNSSGNLAFSANKGLDFSNTSSGTSGTATGQLLNDYEIGSFTPIMKLGTTAQSYAASGNVGVYVRVGNLIHVTMWISLNGKSGTGNVTIEGLPFATLNSTNMYNGFNSGYTSGMTTATGVSGYVVPNTSTLTCFYNAAGASVQLTDAHITSSTSLILTGTYRTN